MDTNSDRSIWNFDDERMKVLHEHMVICEFAFENWNLELVNKKLQTIALIVSGADWSENEWEAIEKSFEEIEELKREIDNSFSEQIKVVLSKTRDCAYLVYVCFLLVAKLGTSPDDLQA
jgi:hypothetical protein